MPRLCILSQYFPPEMGAPQGRLSELGERLIDRGWEVEALTAIPNYPTGKLFPGYRGTRTYREQIGRITTHRLPLIPSKGGFTKRLLTYFSFAGAAAVLGPGLCRRPDLIYVESPPLFIGYAAQLLARRWNCGYVFNVSDLWPDSAVDMGVVTEDSFAVRMSRRLETSLYRNADGITGQTNDICEVIRTRTSTPVELITNSVDPRRFGRDKADAEARALIGTEPGPVFVYAGLLGLAQGLDQILDVAKTFSGDQPGRFVLVGDGPVREHLERRVADEGISRVKILPMQPRDRVPALLGACDIAIITLGGVIRGAVPNKIYEAMASSLPIIIVAEGEAARRVESVGAGVAVVPNDAASLRDACHRMAADETRSRFGSGGRVAAETIYNREGVATKLDAFLRGLLGQREAA